MLIKYKMNLTETHTTTPAAALSLRCTFTGGPNNPLLAPRGVILHNNMLVVADTGQNRVFIWKNFLYEPEQEPDIILGQKEQTDTERNAGAVCTAATLQYPSGVWTNGECLVVADAWNHRVLIWRQVPETNGQPADVVIGQPNFTGNQPNVYGVGKNPTAQSLYWPYGVWSTGNDLFIADTGNRRVLYFEEMPRENFTAAAKVIGQVNFEEKDYDNQNAVWPYSIKISETGAMAIADTQYYRVLVWPHWKQAFEKGADVIIGQPDIHSSGQNQYRLLPASHTLNWCYDACFFMNGISVADTGNSRILLWNRLPEQNNVPADALTGQPHFEINGESSLSMKTSLTNEMYWPFAVNACGEQLVVADTGNHRILFYQPVHAL